jgi:hypothetical protein
MHVGAQRQHSNAGNSLPYAGNSEIEIFMVKAPLSD